jgi:hypothetical protein
MSLTCRPCQPRTDGGTSVITLAVSLSASGVYSTSDFGNAVAASATSEAETLAAPGQLVELFRGGVHGTDVYVAGIGEDVCGARRGVWGVGDGKPVAYHGSSSATGGNQWQQNRLTTRI